MNKFLLTILATIYSTGALADQPKEWQLGFQDPASDGMTEISLAFIIIFYFQ